MDLSVIAFLLLLAIVGLTRMVELRISRLHQQALAEQGIAKRADSWYPWMVVLHVLVLVGAGVEVICLRRPFILILAGIAGVFFVLATGLRWWVIGSLATHWNVEVMPSGALGVVTSGPFRWVRHPNYLGVFVELVALPLIHTAWLTAIFAAVGNALVLRHRLRIEEPLLDADPVYRREMGGKPRFLPRLF